jgi:hypothetical protein
LADTLDCPGAFDALDACTEYEAIGVRVATYDGGAEAVFYTDADDQGAIRASSSVTACYEAVAVDGGYELRDLRTNRAFAVSQRGQDARVLCFDGTQETVPWSAVVGSLPSAPAPASCDPAAPVNQCTNNAGCTARTGANSLCCPNGLGNVCVAAGGSCDDVAPADTCTTSEQCPQGQGCCNLPGRRVCDPGLCGDALCCTLPADAAVCDEACATCRNSTDCPQGAVCCPYTGNTCTSPESCIAPDECELDVDCGDGEVCCRATGVAQCVASDLCSEPCSTNADCGQGKTCCGSQSSPYGSYCTPSNLCDDPPQPACQTSADCGQGNACCHTLSEVACVPIAQCPAACASDGDCRPGQECCGADTRTPICVAAGSCKTDLGDACQQPSDCKTGLTCCPYHNLGDVCVPPEACCDPGEEMGCISIPAISCAADPTVCDAFPLAVCCSAGGAPQCLARSQCTKFYDICEEDKDCGAGSACCDSAPDPSCSPWTAPCE